MSDQTPTDPLRSFIAVEMTSERHYNTVTWSGEAVEAYRAADVDRARAATDEQHQREIADLTKAVQGNALAVVKCSENAAREIAQRDETIRQQDEQIAGYLNREGIAACGHYAVFTLQCTFEDGATRPTCMQCDRDAAQDRAEAAEARCATLTEALEEAVEHMPELTAYQRERKRLVLRDLVQAWRETPAPQKGAPK